MSHQVYGLKSKMMLAPPVYLQVYLSVLNIKFTSKNFVLQFMANYIDWDYLLDMAGWDSILENKTIGVFFPTYSGWNDLISLTQRFSHWDLTKNPLVWRDYIIPRTLNILHEGVVNKTY